jgi:hypothetical protein
MEIMKVIDGYSYKEKFSSWRRRIVIIDQMNKITRILNMKYHSVVCNL